MGRLSSCKYRFNVGGDFMVVALFRMFLLVTLASETGVLATDLHSKLFSHHYGGRSTSQYHGFRLSCGKHARVSYRFGIWMECTCLPNYVGRPPNCRAECNVNVDCPDDKACIDGKCEDSCCSGTCADDATCRVVSHSAYCTCLDGYPGDPHETCLPTPASAKSDDMCKDKKCGQNARCEEGHCICHNGFEGNADDGCQPENAVPVPSASRAAVPIPSGSRIGRHDTYDGASGEDSSDSPTLDGGSVRPRNTHRRRSALPLPSDDRKGDDRVVRASGLQIRLPLEGTGSGEISDYEEPQGIAEAPISIKIDDPLTRADLRKKDTLESTTAIYTTDASTEYLTTTIGAEVTEK